MINQILKDLLASVPGARAVIFLDGDGETIAQTGEAIGDVKLIGAWKEIQFDRIKTIAGRLGFGKVEAVLFSREDGNELVVPVAEEYCLLLFLSAYANIQDAMTELSHAIALLKQDIL
ncbi:MAG: roadblock/LC7 domain-containing protein [Nitrospirota bacterium]